MKPFLNVVSTLANRIESIGDRICIAILTEIKSEYTKNTFEIQEAVRCIKIGSYLGIAVLIGFVIIF